jgi:hypothetical protein
MREFFRGWKRKIGVLTLGLACVLMMVWARSNFVWDSLEIPFGEGTAFGLSSLFGGIDVYRTTAREKGWVKYPLTWYASNVLTEEDADEDFRPYNPWTIPYAYEWRWDLAGFHAGVTRVLGFKCEDCMIPYWFVVLSLILFSAWCLLTKPRTKPVGISN